MTIQRIWTWQRIRNMNVTTNKRKWPYNENERFISLLPRLIENSKNKTIPVNKEKKSFLPNIVINCFLPNSYKGGFINIYKYLRSNYILHEKLSIFTSDKVLFVSVDRVMLNLLPVLFTHSWIRNTHHPIGEKISVYDNFLNIYKYLRTNNTLHEKISIFISDTFDKYQRYNFSCKV
jgi:hypothetical protein